MFAIQSGLRLTPRLTGSVTRTYSNTIVSAPPEVKMSSAEKIFSFFGIAGAILFWPMYMAPNFKNYAEKK